MTMLCAFFLAFWFMNSSPSADRSSNSRKCDAAFPSPRQSDQMLMQSPSLAFAEQLFHTRVGRIV